MSNIGGKNKKRIILDSLRDLKKLGVGSKDVEDSLGEVFDVPVIHEINIPVSIFNYDLSALELIVKYARENLELSYKQISSLTNRKNVALAVCCSAANRKLKEKIVVKESGKFFPITVLKDRKFSVLENIVAYLKKSGLSYHEIALLLRRDDRTIWTVYNRYEKKK